MKNCLNYSLAFALVVPTLVVAQDYTADAAKLTAKTAYTNALIADLKADDALTKQQSSATDAADAAKDAERKATLDAIVNLGKGMPKGIYTETDTGVATPKSTELAYKNLDGASEAVRFRIKAQLTNCKVGKCNVIVGSSIPAPVDSLEFRLYDSLITDIVKEANSDSEINSTEVHSLGAAAVITALPDILNAVAGFFRMDRTEDAFAGKLADATAASSFMGKVIEVGESMTPIFFPSRESYSFKDLATIQDSPFVGRIAALSNIDTKLKVKIDGIKTPNEEKGLADAKGKVQETTLNISALKARRALLEDLMKIDTHLIQTYEPIFVDLSNKIVKLELTKTGQDNAVNDAKAKLDAATASRDRYQALHDRIAKLLTTLKSTDGTPPLFIRLLRDEQLGFLNAESPVRYLAISVVASPQSTITEKRFWGQSTFGSSLVALEYRIADATGQILDSGVVRSYEVKKYDVPATGNPSGTLPTTTKHK